MRTDITISNLSLRKLNPENKHAQCAHSLSNDISYGVIHNI